MTLLSELNVQKQWIDLPNGRLLMIDDFLSINEADTLMAYLKSHVSWSQEEIKMFGRLIAQPRLQAWYGDKSYTYSGLTMSAKPLTKPMQEMKSRCESVAEQTFNSVFLNLYRNGQDSMGAHQDNEPELGKNPTIASLSLGATRRFTLKHIQTKQTHNINLTHGSLLVMAGEMQHYWKHSLPKTKRVFDERINLTFRAIY